MASSVRMSSSPVLGAAIVRGMSDVAVGWVGEAVGGAAMAVGETVVGGEVVFGDTILVVDAQT